MPQTSFRFLDAGRDACLAGEAEGDQSILGMYRLRPQQNGFRLLSTFTRWLAIAAAIY